MLPVSRRQSDVLGYAVMLGGLLGLFFPNSYLYIFGFASGGSTNLFLQLTGLGVFCGGLLVYLSGARYEHSTLKTVFVAGLGAAIVFVANFGLGYPIGMTILTAFALATALFSLYLMTP